MSNSSVFIIAKRESSDPDHASYLTFFYPESRYSNYLAIFSSFELAKEYIEKVWRDKNFSTDHSKEFILEISNEKQWRFAGMKLLNSAVSKAALNPCFQEGHSCPIRAIHIPRVSFDELKKKLNEISGHVQPSSTMSENWPAMDLYKSPQHKYIAFEHRIIEDGDADNAFKSKGKEIYKKFLSKSKFIFGVVRRRKLKFFYLIVLLGAIYWVGVRPVMIRKECNTWVLSIPKETGYSPSMLESDYLYKFCLRGRGIDIR